MKQYKFRAWDTDEYRDHKIVHMDCEEIFKYYPKHLITQWTGLKDKNGIDIYEGDIVKYVAGKNYENIGVVTWVDENNSFNLKTYPFMCGFVIHNEKENKTDKFEWDETNYMEVIGNIFEEKYLEEIKNGDWDDDNY